MKTEKQIYTTPICSVIEIEIEALMLNNSISSYGIEALERNEVIM